MNRSSRSVRQVDRDWYLVLACENNCEGGYDETIAHAGRPVSGAGISN